MTKIYKMRPLDTLRKANQNRDIKEVIELPLGNDETLKVVLSAPDMFTIMKDQERCYQKEYAECIQSGMEVLPINETDWNKTLNQITDTDVRKAMQDDKPVNLAEQVAKKNARFDTIRVLLPKALRDENGDLICKDPKEQLEMQQMISSNAEWMRLLTEGYVRLVGQINEVNESAKNLQQRGDSTNGDSKNSSQDATTTGAPSAKS